MMTIACNRTDCIHNRGYCKRVNVGVEIDEDGKCLNYEAEESTQSADTGKSSDQVVDANKMMPLTLENGFEITNADGTPINWHALGRKYKDQLCYCDIDGFYIGQDGQLILMDDCGKAVEVDRGDYHIEVSQSADTSKMLVIELGSGGIGIAVGKSRGSTVMDTLVFAELQDEHSIGAPVRANPHNVCAIIKCANIESAKVLKMQVDTIVNALGKPKNNPLTLDELREMEGKPVWVTFEPEEDGTPIAPCWMLVNVEEKRLVTEYEWVDWNDEGYKAYRTKPEKSHAD